MILLWFVKEIIKICLSFMQGTLRRSMCWLIILIGVHLVLVLCGNLLKRFLIGLFLFLNLESLQAVLMDIRKKDKCIMLRGIGRMSLLIVMVVPVKARQFGPLLEELSLIGLTAGTWWKIQPSKIKRRILAEFMKNGLEFLPRVRMQI